MLHPWDFPGKSTGVGCHFLLQRIFPTQGSNLGLPQFRQTVYHLSHQGSIYLIYIYLTNNKLQYDKIIYSTFVYMHSQLYVHIYTFQIIHSTLNFCKIYVFSIHIRYSQWINRIKLQGYFSHIESDLLSKQWVTKKREYEEQYLRFKFFEGIAMKGRWFSEKTQATNVSEQKLKP